MEDKKIDSLFQEKLKNLEATPHKEVWNTIESKLKNKKRRVLPMWWYSGGVAAILVLGFLLFPFFNDSNSPKKQPVIIAAPDTNTENNNLIKKESNPIFNRENEKTLLVDESKKSKKFILKKKVKKDEKLPLLVAKETNNPIKKETEGLVSKKAMEKIFLTDNKLKNETDSLKSNTIIAKENILESRETKKFIPLKEAVNIDKKSDALFKNETSKKDILTAVNDAEKDEKTNTIKPWSITPIVAILSSNSFSKTSPIDANLSNTTSGNNSYSYGIQVGYKVNNKWSIRSGVHIQEISFSNSQISVVSSKSNNTSIAFNSGDRFKLQDASVENLNAESLSLNAVTIDGNLDQKYGYIEIPIEIKYNLLEVKKLKTELIAGFSSLFLNKNTIRLNADSLSRSGEATNLNNINFSGNFGLDFKYGFDKNWSLNLNPMFKTQLNTFSKDSNGFKPYFIGVYSGITYQF
jgi:hypothetical protein